MVPRPKHTECLVCSRQYTNMHPLCACELKVTRLVRTIGKYKTCRKAMSPLDMRHAGTSLESKRCLRFEDNMGENSPLTSERTEKTELNVGGLIQIARYGTNPFDDCRPDCREDLACIAHNTTRIPRLRNLLARNINYQISDLCELTNSFCHFQCAGTH